MYLLQIVAIFLFYEIKEYWQEHFEMICPVEEGKYTVFDFGKSIGNSGKILIRKDNIQIHLMRTVLRIIQESENILFETFIDIVKDTTTIPINLFMN